MSRGAECDVKGTTLLPPGFAQNPLDHGPYDSFDGALYLMGEHDDVELGAHTCPCGHRVDPETGHCLISDDYGVHQVPRTGYRCVECGRPVDVWRIVRS